MITTSNLGTLKMTFLVWKRTFFFIWGVWLRAGNEEFQLSGVNLRPRFQFQRFRHFLRKHKIFQTNLVISFALIIQPLLQNFNFIFQLLNHFLDTLWVISVNNKTRCKQLTFKFKAGIFLYLYVLFHLSIWGVRKSQCCGHFETPFLLKIPTNGQKKTCTSRFRKVISWRPFEIFSML